MAETVGDVSGRERAFGDLSEKDLQSAVDAVLTWKGWLTYHTFDSRRSKAGFPDLVAVKGSRIMWVEFKSEKGKVRPEQVEWLDRLANGTDEVYLVRPSTEQAFHENVDVLGSNLTCHWHNQPVNGRCPEQVWNGDMGPCICDGRVHGGNDEDRN